MRLMTIHLMACLVGSVHAQPVEVDVHLALRLPQATCALVVQGDGNFGAVTGQAPMVHLSPKVSAGSGRAPGRFMLIGQYASDYMVSIEFPRQITGPGTPLAYEGQWGQARTTTDPFTIISGRTLHLSAEGPFERHFWVGGKIQGLSTQTMPGLYVGQISITTTCN